jgi:predicted membrane chloride channel (bestrophin family)
MLNKKKEKKKKNLQELLFGFVISSTSRGLSRVLAGPAAFAFSHHFTSLVQFFCFLQEYDAISESFE